GRYGSAGRRRTLSMQKAGWYRYEPQGSAAGIEIGEPDTNSNEHRMASIRCRSVAYVGGSSSFFYPPSGRSIFTLLLRFLSANRRRPLNRIIDASGIFLTKIRPQRLAQCRIVNQVGELAQPVARLVLGQSVR